jgi:CubicO group peptidase (beta-lactamase class C family)
MILRDGTPEEAGMIPERINLIEERANAWIADEKAVGLVLIGCRKGIVFLKKAFGKQLPEPGDPDLTIDAIFPVMSISKPVTATCIMQLVENGIIDLNHTVQKYIPEFKGEWKEDVFIYNILNHTSGLRDEHVWQNLVTLENNPEIPPAPEGVSMSVYRSLLTAYRIPLASKPGEIMQYCSPAYELLAEIIRRVTGLTLNDYARINIFEPLGMTDSHFILPDEKLPRVVRRRNEDFRGEWFNRPDHHKRGSAAGGLYTKAEDMAIFSQMFLNNGIYNGKRILHKASIIQMTMNQTPGKSAYFANKFIEVSSWGYGWNVRSNKKDDAGILRSALCYDHGGTGGTSIFIDPENGLFYIFFGITRKKTVRDLFSNMITSAVID